MRKQIINPCERKGEVQIPTHQKASPHKGAYRRYGACECTKAQCGYDKDGKKINLNFAMDTGPNADGTHHPVKSKRNVPEGSILVAPCTETFKDAKSSGTKLHSRLMGHRTRFKGCQALEEDLIREGLVKLWISNRETLELSDILDLVVPTEDDYATPVSKETLGTYGRAMAYEGEMELQEKSWNAHKIAHLISPLTHSISDVIRPAPRNFRQAQARKLLEEGCYLGNPKLRTALLLVARGITDKESIEDVFPDLDYIQYKQLEGVVNHEIDKTLPERAKKFKGFLDTLTTAQKEAIEFVYLKNDFQLSQEDVAKKLGISVDSLFDRLQGAKRKLLKAYPEFQRTNRRKSKNRCQSEAKGPLFDKSGRQVPGPDEVMVMQVNPITKEKKPLIVKKASKSRTHFLPNINRNEIRRKVRELCPIPYPSI